MLSSYINRNEVVRRLIKIRCKLADKMADRKQLYDFVRFETKSKEDRRSNKDKFIYSLFPPRSQWCHIGMQRKNIDSVKRNEIKLLNTYKMAIKQNKNADWYIRLCQEADKIVRMALSPVSFIPVPIVHVLEKKREDDRIVCRPVCTFDLEVKIVLSLYNKVLTNLFDPLFLPCSYAFRVPKDDSLPFMHLKAVQDIQNFRKEHIGQPLYVAECDMQKFYDTIDHRVIKARFNMLFSKAKNIANLNGLECRCIRSWFYAYVDCFSFAKHVDVYNSMPNHPIWKHIANRGGKQCSIDWVRELREHVHVCRRERNLFGVPQGGPLSGLIANIVMHFVDLAVERANEDKDIRYIRFCDDMLLVGAKKTEVENTLNVYNNSIKKARLYPHKSKSMNYAKAKDFWDGKTRGPYEWGEHGKHVYPWITFVGFDINWRGNLRIRKKSMDKHVVKQHDTVWHLLNHYSTHSPRYQQYSIISSLKSRMVAMSVGRVGLWNYKDNPNTHSWMAAFSILDKNPWSEKQMRLLDRHRNVELNRAQKYIWNLTCPNRKMSGDHKLRGRFYLGKPFSYYGQAFKEW